MAWTPISLIVPQYEDANGNPYSGAVLKAYAAGTSTNIVMATDSTGATTFTSIALNASGYPTHSGSIVVPHVAQSYKLALYANQAAADADTPAIWSIDNIAQLINSGVILVDDAESSGVTNVITATHTTTGTPVAGIGTGVALATETAVGNTETGLVIEALTTDVTAGSEDFDFVLKLMAAGAAAAQKLRVSSLGRLFGFTSFDLARATVASHATTADIWSVGNQIDWTGTETTTAFPNAPQAGAERTLICAGACSFTAGANMLIDGVSSGLSVTCAANDIVVVRAVSTTQFKLSRRKYDGTAQVETSTLVTRVARTSNTILGLSNLGNFIDITSGTFSQTFDAAATLGNGWFVYLRNSGTGDITLEPDGAELIDGLTNYIMYPGECRLIQCSGTALTSVVISGFRKTFTSSGTFTKPPGYLRFGGLMWGGGGGGNNPSTACGGGGGGCIPFSIESSAVGTTETYTQGAGGAATAVGGNSTFGSLFTAYGGAGGGPGAGGLGLGGGGGGSLSAGSGSSGGSPAISGTTSQNSDGLGGGSGGDGANNPGGSSGWGGGGGGVTTSAGGSSVYGGGGGGTTAGTSIFGGNGGASGANGTQPGGGGGAGSTSGAGGQLTIWSIA